MPAKLPPDQRNRCMDCGCELTENNRVKGGKSRRCKPCQNTKTAALKMRQKTVYWETAVAKERPCRECNDPITNANRSASDPYRCKECHNRYQREHYEKTRERRAEQRKAMRAARKNAFRAWERAYYARNKDTLQAQLRVRRDADPIRHRQYNRNWVLKHPTYSREANRRRRTKMPIRLFPIPASFRAVTES